MQLGKTLKALRHSRNFTLADVANKLNLSPSLLSQIENEKVVPSLQTLSSLLSFYSITLSDFFKQVEQRRYIFVKREDAELFNYDDQKVSLTLLASKLQNNTLESYMVELSHGGSIEVARLPEEPTGERFMLMLSGCLTVIIDDNETFAMAEGDSLNFKCQAPCSITNADNIPARFLIAGVPPVFL
jgi:transcriptional regulator with XRE-family HTH domain